MSITSRGGGISSTLTIILFALAGAAGTAASLYAMVIAYMAGSSAQAAIDGCPPADPVSLARESMKEVAAATGVEMQDDGVINVEEESVSVNDAGSHTLNQGSGDAE